MPSENKKKSKFLFCILYCCLWGLQVTVILKSTYKSEVTVDEIKKLSFEMIANSSRKGVSQVSGNKLSLSYIF